MIESYLRPIYQKILVDPIAKRIDAITAITPERLTIAGCFAGIAFAPLIYQGNPGLACMALLISGYLDTLDGTLARLRKTSSPQGATMDIIADRLVEFSVIVGIYLIAPETRSLAALFMLGSILLCVTTFLVVGIFETHIGEKSFHYSVGLMERAEAFIFFILIALKPSWFPFLAWSFTGLVLLTAAARIYPFLHRCPMQRSFSAALGTRNPRRLEH
jgi:phosphatidylglycerophosphate synthase